jgi:iron complex outermembrane receptor protein
MPAFKAAAISSTILAGAALLSPAPGAAQQATLEEIVVTAQRREQNLQDIPLSVTAISGDILGESGVLDVTRIKILTPGMNFGQTGANAHLTIRGARTEGILQNVQPVISFYNDEIYRSGTLQAFSPLVDVARVEVLRGPQGTLFGRNAYGGAVNIVSNRPAEKFAAELTGTVGNYDRRDLEGFVNVPVGDVVAFRLAGALREHEGYVRSTFDRDESIKDQDDEYVRGQLLVRPTETFSLLLRGEYWQQGGNGSADFNYSTPGTPENASVFGKVVPLNVIGGDPDDVDKDPYVIARDVDFILDAEQTTWSAVVEWDLGGANLKLLLAQTDYDNFHSNDIDMSPVENGREGQYDEIETRQEEIQLSDDGSGSLRWLIGAFFMQETSLDSFYYECINTFECFFANRRNMDTDAAAVYGQLTLPLMDERLNVTLGLRYSDEHQTFRVRSRYRDETFADPGTNAPPDFLDTTFDPTNPDDDIFEDFKNDADFNPVTWRIAADYRLAEGRMVYGSVATGYSAGGFNSVPNPLTGKFTFPEQTVTAYEIGSKNTLLDGTMTLNVALYYNDYHEMLSEPAVDIGTTIVFNAIGGDGTAYGAEIELDWMPVEAFLLNLRASLLRAEYGRFQTGTGSGLTQGNITVTTVDGTEIPFVDVSGRQIAFSPDFTLGLSARYTFGLGSLTPGLDFYYSSDYMTADQYYPFARQDDYTQTDLRLTWDSPQSHWSAQAFVQNLEDEAVLQRTNIFTQRQIGQTFGDPRLYGFTLSYRY